MKYNPNKLVIRFDNGIFKIFWAYPSSRVDFVERLLCTADNVNDLIAGIDQAQKENKITGGVQLVSSEILKIAMN